MDSSLNLLKQLRNSLCPLLGTAGVVKSGEKVTCPLSGENARNTAEPVLGEHGD